ncbi:MAG TPA: hypothetical protein QGH10_08040 [Armatimonadota bacterium]|nr:hypothetical protein [Armatimonadota bacterium]
MSNDVKVLCPTPREKHHFFGYYDKFPYDSTGRYLLSLETSFIDRPPTPDDVAGIGMVDLHDGNRWIPIAETHAWYWQQGTMLQWLETAPDRHIIYNAREDGQFISIIRDAHSGEIVRKLPRPVYAVSRDGRQAVSVNFSRVHNHRPGYGYVGVPDAWADDPAPAEDGIYQMDLATGENQLIISLDQIVQIEPEDSMDGASHWFNHLQFNQDDSRFIFLHRWVGEKPPWKTRLYTAAPDGSDICLVNSHDMTSHFDWESPGRILAWATRHEVGNFYYLFDDQAEGIEKVGEGILTTDGHCSYSPDGQWVLTDTYPGKDHKRTLLLYRPADERRVDIGRFYAPPELSGEIRCDLHPRWNRDGTEVCFDSAHEGDRQLYTIDVSAITKGNA